MALPLTNAEKRTARNHAEKRAQELGVEIDFIKSNVEDAVQTIIDELDAAPFKASVSAAIDTATAPFQFTNAEKKFLGVVAYRILADRDNV